MIYRLLLPVFAVFLTLSACSDNHSLAEPDALVAQFDPDFLVTDTSVDAGIVPKPRDMVLGQGVFTLDAATQIAASADLMGLADYMRQQFSPATGYTFPLADTSVAGNVIRLELSDIESSNDEAYELSVTSEIIRIRASSKTGLFWGIQSLRQLMPADIETNAPINRRSWSVPVVEIRDEPAFSYRGMHLDVSRTFFPVEFIRQYIDLLALHKLNYLHWHLTDDQGWRIQINAFPKLTEIGAWRTATVVGHTYDRDGLYDNQTLGGFYTQDQIRELVAYAQSRQITIIPEIDIPGHASAILAAYPEFGCTGEMAEVQSNFGVFPEVLCPSEKTFAFLDQVFAEVAELFPSPYIHVGGDEVKTEQWQNCDSCKALMQREGLKDYMALQGYMIKRVEASINKLGKQIIGWDEILEGDVNPSATITSWRGIEGAIHAAREGHDAIMAPGSHLYFDHYQSRSIDEPLAIHGLTPVSETYSFNVIPEALAQDPAAKRILGAQGHLWTEYVRTPAKAQYMVLPRMSALAEVVWTDASQKSWPDFARRLPKMFERFEAAGLNYATSVYAINVEVESAEEGFVISLDSDMPDVQIRYTIDGSLPNSNSPVYRGPVKMKAGLLRAKAQDPVTGQLFEERRLTLVDHLARGAKVVLRTDADRAWNTEPEQTLVDGVLSRDQIFQLDDWATFNEGGLIAELDLLESKQLSLVNIGFNAGRYRHFYAPSNVTVELSETGTEWRRVGELDQAALAAESLSATVTFAKQSARYVRVAAEDGARRYSTEHRAPVPVTLYFDEIIVK